MLAALRRLGQAAEDRAERIALLQLFLERFPHDPNAAEQLDRLVGQLLASDKPEALAALDRFGTQVFADLTRLETLRAGALMQNRRFDDGRAIYERLLREAPDEESRATNSFWIAYSFIQENRWDDARTRFELLIARYGDDPSAALQSVVAGARNQLTRIAEHQSKKKRASAAPAWRITARAE
jgi:tetratricopeptide (TPR) repeat protein